MAEILYQILQHDSATIRLKVYELVTDYKNLIEVAEAFYSTERNNRNEEKKIDEEKKIENLLDHIRPCKLFLDTCRENKKYKPNQDIIVKCKLPDSIRNLKVRFDDNIENFKAFKTLILNHRA